MNSYGNIIIPDSLRQEEKSLLDKGLICFKKEQNGSTSLLINLRHVVKTIEEIGNIPLSCYIYKKIINNKREHPSTIKNMLITTLSMSFFEYTSKGKSLEKMDKTQIKKVDRDEMLNHTLIIKKYYNLTPMRKPNDPEFIWFSPDKNLYQELKENSLKQDRSWFPGYDKYISQGYSSPEITIR